ncbi:MAG: M42 family metallopeptidase [Clostridiales bacterium]|mgnify:CR=1 FL=1|jgi:endoglucanase|nr:M42 family metallopeptidase [Clostridiales bacterium]
MLEHLKNLCELNGASGNEHMVRDYILDEIKGKCSCHVDNLGNIIAFKKGQKASEKKLMIAAHMDEVGLIITSVKSDGALTISAVGGIDASVLIGRQVLVGENNINGVIGAKAVHNLTAEEKKKAVSIDKLYVDIGATDKSEAEKYVSLGDYVHFCPDYEDFGNGKIVSKALDDRVGCAIMLDLINRDFEYDIYFAFTVQEELGLRGAKTAAFAIEPDFSIVLETTTAADIPDVAGEKRVCELGKGAVVSFMDRSTMYDKELYKIAFEIAEENKIPCQTKTMIAGGNDSGAIHVSGKGVRTIAISAPCRYLHSPSCVVQKSDLEACEILTEKLIVRIFNI